jgi:uncharacterized membrane protein
VQLVCVLAGIALGLVLPRIIVAPTLASSRVTESLVSVGFGILGVAGIVFSLLFLVAQWAFGSLSPRLSLFRDDPIVWRTYGLVLGIFVFCLTAAVAIGNAPTVSIILPIVEAVTVLAAVALIRVLLIRAFASIQLAPMLAAIAGRGRTVIDDLYPTPYTAGTPAGEQLPPLRRTITWPHRQAVFQQLDIRRLLDADGNAVVALRAGIGDTLQEGAPLADVHGGDLDDAAVLGAVITGQERNFHQDPLFAFRLLADIGLRALSPAINDPATAVQVLDTMEGLLRPLVSRDLADTGTRRVVLALPSWEDYLTIALDDLIESGAKSPMFLRRARTMLTGLRDTAPPPRRAPIGRRLRRVDDLATPAARHTSTEVDTRSTRLTPYGWRPRAARGVHSAQDRTGRRRQRHRGVEFDGTD